MHAAVDIDRYRDREFEFEIRVQIWPAAAAAAAARASSSRFLLFEHLTIPVCARMHFDKGVTREAQGGACLADSWCVRLALVDVVRHLDLHVQVEVGVVLELAHAISIARLLLQRALLDVDLVLALRAADALEAGRG